MPVIDDPFDEDLGIDDAGDVVASLYYLPLPAADHIPTVAELQHLIRLPIKGKPITTGDADFF